MTPTANSYATKGRGKRKAETADNDASITPPTKILPKRRKENEIILVNSEINSSSPMNRLKGLNDKNLLMYSLNPSVRILIECVAIIETRARARVKLRSVEGLRINGTKIFPSEVCSQTPKAVMTGTSSLQLEMRIIKKNVIKYGKIFFARSEATDSVRP